MALNNTCGKALLPRRNLAGVGRGGRALAAAAWALIFFVAGCQQSPYELAPVRGTVTIDGRPLAAGRVMFAPIAQGANGHEPGKPAFGTLQSDGTFVLTTYDDNDGAIIGDHWITIYGPKGDDAGAAGSAPKFAKFVVRQKQTVAGGQENVVDIQLTSQDIARYASK